MVSRAGLESRQVPAFRLHEQVNECRLLSGCGFLLEQSRWSQRIQARHEQWAERLPSEPDALWAEIAALAHEEQMGLLAHCVSHGVNALFEATKGYDGRISAHGVAQRIAAADALANVVGLDMAEAGWTPTVENYLGRVTKPRIIEAVREAKGDATAVLIDHLKKGDMAREAERLQEQARVVFMRVRSR